MRHIVKDELTVQNVCVKPFYQLSFESLERVEIEPGYQLNNIIIGNPISTFHW